REKATSASRGNGIPTVHPRASGTHPEYWREPALNRRPSSIAQRTSLRGPGSERIPFMATATATARLLNPATYDASAFDPETRRVLRATIDWFEEKGKARLLAESHSD